MIYGSEHSEGWGTALDVRSDDDLMERLQTILNYAPNVTLAAALQFIRDQDKAGC